MIQATRSASTFGLAILAILMACCSGPRVREETNETERVDCIGYASDVCIERGRTQAREGKMISRVEGLVGADFDWYWNNNAFVAHAHIADEEVCMNPSQVQALEDDARYFVMLHEVHHLLCPQAQVMDRHQREYSADAGAMRQMVNLADAPLEAAQAALFGFAYHPSYPSADRRYRSLKSWLANGGGPCKN